MTDDADDETRRLLRAADPARSLPMADPGRVSALLEETMSQPENAPKSPAQSRLLLIAGVAAAAVVATVVAIGVTGGDDEPEVVGDAPIALPSLSTTELQASGPGEAKCMVPTVETARRQTVAFEGIVTSVADGTVVLAPTHFYTGEETSRVTIAAPDPYTSESPGEFVVGKSYLVGAVDGQVGICGLTGPADDTVLRELYEEAYGR